MLDGINIEIIGNYKERYPAKIHSFAADNKLIIKFDENPTSLYTVSINDVLLISENNESKHIDYSVGCDVLLLQKIDDSYISLMGIEDAKLTKAWWPAKIEKLKGCFAAVNFANKNNELSNDIVELSGLRPMESGRRLSPSDIHVHEMIVTEDLCEFCGNYDIRGDLNKWCGQEIIVNFDRINKKLQIFSTDQEVIRRASLLDASFMRLLRQKKLIHMQKDELTKRLNNTLKNQYKEEFTVAEELIGLAIGAQGSNIKKAREIEGVISIELDNYTQTFIISAQTQEACKAARSQLEYMKKIFYVPKDVVSKVIGKNGNQIQDIIDQSGVMRVRVVEGPDLDNWKDNENKAMLIDHVPFVFVGNVNSIRDACLLLEFSIDHHREIDRLQRERDEIQREISNSQASLNIMNRFANHSISSDREDDHFKSELTGNYNSPRGYNRGRNNYRNISSSDIEQRHDNYGEDQLDVAMSRKSNQRYHRGGSLKKSPSGNGDVRQGSLPPLSSSVINNNNGHRRYHQQQRLEDDTDDCGSFTNESETGAHQRVNHSPKYRGGAGNRGRGHAGRGHSNHVNGSRCLSPKNSQTPPIDDDSAEQILSQQDKKSSVMKKNKEARHS